MSNTITYITKSGKEYKFTVGDIIHLGFVDDPTDPLKITKISDSGNGNKCFELENQNYLGMFYALKLDDRLMEEIISHKTVEEIEAEHSAETTIGYH